MSNKPKPKSSIPGKADLKAKQAALEAQRKRNQGVALFVGAVIVLVLIVGAIFISSRPPEAPVDKAAIDKEYADMKKGTTAEGAYPVSFPALGDPNAPVKMEEISSFACPVCQNYHDTTLVKLYDKIRAGQLYFVYMPTTRTGDYTRDGTIYVTKAAYCAMKQDKFWEMHEVLFDWQKQFAANTPDKARVRAGAEKLGLDLGKFDACVDSKEAQKYIDDSDNYVSDVRKMVGTPSIFLFANGTQIKPPQEGSSTPGSLYGISFGELTGLIEANQKKPDASTQPTVAATAAATTAPTTAATAAK